MTTETQTVDQQHQLVEELKERKRKAELEATVNRLPQPMREIYNRRMQELGSPNAVLEKATQARKLSAQQFEKDNQAALENEVRELRIKHGRNVQPHHVRAIQEKYKQNVVDYKAASEKRELEAYDYDSPVVVAVKMLDPKGREILGEILEDFDAEKIHALAMNEAREEYLSGLQAEYEGKIKELARKREPWKATQLRVEYRAKGLNV